MRHSQRVALSHSAAARGPGEQVRDPGSRMRPVCAGAAGDSLRLGGGQRDSLCPWGRGCGCLGPALAPAPSRSGPRATATSQQRSRDSPGLSPARPRPRAHALPSLRMRSCASWTARWRAAGATSSTSSCSRACECAGTPPQPCTPLRRPPRPCPGPAPGTGSAVLWPSARLGAAGPEQKIPAAQAATRPLCTAAARPVPSNALPLAMSLRWRRPCPAPGDAPAPCLSQTGVQGSWGRRASPRPWCGCWGQRGPGSVCCRPAVAF